MRTHYRGLIETAAASSELDPDLIEAIVLAESAGLTAAYRFEPGFWKLYMAAKREWAGAIPERVSASYGLMQVMYPVAVELGYDKAAPPEGLFVPEVGLAYGMLKLLEVLAWAEGDVVRALAAYNGGKRGNVAAPFRNAAYAARVLTFLPDGHQLRGQAVHV